MSFVGPGDTCVLFSPPCRLCSWLVSFVSCHLCCLSWWPGCYLCVFYLSCVTCVICQWVGPVWCSVRCHLCSLLFTLVLFFMLPLPRRSSNINWSFFRYRIFFGISFFNYVSLSVSRPSRNGLNLPCLVCRVLPLGGSVMLVFVIYLGFISLQVYTVLFVNTPHTFLFLFYGNEVVSPSPLRCL